MRKLLLIPTGAFPYFFCIYLAYGFVEGFVGSIFTVLGDSCLACCVVAVVCNIIFMVLSKNQDSKSLLKAVFILKLIHIPSYVLIFILGLMMGLMFFMTFPFIALLVLIDCITLFLSGMISVFSLIKNISKNRVLSLIALICQFFFCADIISLFIINILSKKELQTD